MNKKELLLRLEKRIDRVWFAVSKEKKPDRFTKAIQMFQGTNYSHSLVIYFSLDLEDFVVANAHGQASQLDTIEQFDEIDEVEHLYEKMLTPIERLNVINAIVELDGIDYSEMQIFDIGLNAIFGRLDLDENGVEGIICSEYSERVAIASGLPPASKILNKSIEYLNPKDNVKVWNEFSRTRHDFFKL